MKTRCRGCRKLTDFGNTYCPSCFEKVKKTRKESKTESTKEADKLIGTVRWKNLRAEIIRRDNGCCALCYIRGRVEYRLLQVHHIIKRTEDSSLAYEPSNLITVCRSCHEEVEKLSVGEQRELFSMKERCNEKPHFLL